MAGVDLQLLMEGFGRGISAPSRAAGATGPRGTAGVYSSELHEPTAKDR